MKISDAVYVCLLILLSAIITMLALLLLPLPLLLFSFSGCSKMRWLMEMHLDGDSQLNDVN